MYICVCVCVCARQQLVTPWCGLWFVAITPLPLVNYSIGGWDSLKLVFFFHCRRWLVQSHQTALSTSLYSPIFICKKLWLLGAAPTLVGVGLLDQGVAAVRVGGSCCVAWSSWNQGRALISFVLGRVALSELLLWLCVCLMWFVNFSVVPSVRHWVS